LAGLSFLIFSDFSVVVDVNQTKAALVVLISASMVQMFNSVVDLPDIMSILEIFN